MKSKIKQLFMDEWHNWWVLFDDGLVYRKRALGQGNNYEKWKLHDLIGEIKKDIGV